MSKVHYQAKTILKGLKIGGLVTVIFIGVALLIFIGLGLYQTYKVEHSKNQELFDTGKLPDPLPDGSYKGTVSKRLSTSWQGKVFDKNHQSGINQFNNGQRYVFKTYSAQGLRDRNISALRIDYNQPGNPWWLHFIVDEIVQTQPDHYLGKVHLKIIPGLTFSLTFFELQK